MNQLENEHISCPYCGETIEIIIDCSIPEQVYIEDCEVCCRPISLLIYVSDSNNIRIFPRNENE